MLNTEQYASDKLRPIIYLFRNVRMFNPNLPSPNYICLNPHSDVARVERGSGYLIKRGSEKEENLNSLNFEAF